MTARDAAFQMRLHQWAKNLLLFAPLLLGHQLTWSSFFDVLLAALAFGLCASAVYIVNDLVDIEADRLHPTKCDRPIAAGRINTSMAAIMATVSVLMATLISIFVGPAFIGWLAAYLVVTTLYSFAFKRLAIVDVLALSALYTLRIMAGGAAAHVEVSPWLLMYSMFLFTSLAFIKRFTELQDVIDRDGHSLAGRGYSTPDVDMIRVIGPSIGLISVLVFSLYLASPQVVALYEHPTRLWFLVPVQIYWITRMWLLAQRRLMHEDPVLFTLQDWPSYIVAAVGVVIVILAI